MEEEVKTCTAGACVYVCVHAHIHIHMSLILRRMSLSPSHTNPNSLLHSRHDQLPRLAPQS